MRYRGGSLQAQNGALHIYEGYGFKTLLRFEAVPRTIRSWRYCAWGSSGVPWALEVALSALESPESALSDGPHSGSIRRDREASSKRGGESWAEAALPRSPTGVLAPSSGERRSSSSGQVCTPGTSLARLRPRILIPSSFDDSLDMSPRRHVDADDALREVLQLNRLVGRDPAPLRSDSSTFGSRSALLVDDQRRAGAVPDRRG